MDTSKHAYLIMAHNNFYCLEKLLLLLDDARNDIFLHIDVKADNFDFSYFRQLCKNAQVIFSDKRMDVRWGGESQVLCEMYLFRIASQHKTYHYYHLLSGADLPLLSQNAMHAFFEDRNECFITIHDELSVYDYQRISRYHFLFGRNHFFSDRLNAYADILQSWLKVDRIKRLKGMEIKRGWNWVSLPHSAVLCILTKEKWIRRIVRYSVCADEIYKQIVLLNAKETFFYQDGKYSSLRFVDWEHCQGNHPHTFTVSDFDRLKNAQQLFARKFDEIVDREIIDLIYDYVSSQEA